MPDPDLKNENTGTGSDEGANEGSGESASEKGLVKIVGTDGEETLMSPEEINAVLAENREKLEASAKLDAESRNRAKGADDKFRESARDRRLRETLVKAKTGSVEAYETLAKDFPETGITAEHVAEFKKLGVIEGADGKEGSVEDTPVGIKDLDPELKKDILDARQVKDEKKVKGIISKMNGILDKDDHLAHIMSDKALGPVVKHAREKALGVLKRRAELNRAQGPGWSPSPEDYRDALQASRAFLMDLGYLDDPADKDAGTVRRVVPTLGRSPSATTSLHRTKEPLKRPDSSKVAEHDDYVSQRLGQLLDGEG